MHTSQRRGLWRLVGSSVAVLTAWFLVASRATPCRGAEPAEAREHATPPAANVSRPAMRDFMGLNVHTVAFKPELYAPVCRRLRDYHPLAWDTGDDTSHLPPFPMAGNGVPWDQLYGKWAPGGYDIDACLIFDDLPAAKWKNKSADAHAYGQAFAHFFGPSGAHPWVSSIEVGNEPGKYSDADYRAIFQGMAAGVRAGDSKMKIATCAVVNGPGDEWSKSISVVDSLGDLCDVLNVHSYAFEDGWPTWRRSYPEDPAIPFLENIRKVVHFRDAKLPGRAVWVTEFGYDSASRPPARDGPWANWVGVSDEQQAQYIVRSFLILSAMDLDRAYLYFFNDKDEAQLHGASGITRNYQPKPSFHAMAHLYKTLGDYHFSRAPLKRDGDVYCYEYRKAAPSKERMLVIWSPTADAKPTRRKLAMDLGGSPASRAERMPLTADVPPAVPCEATAAGLEIEVAATPVYVWLK